MLESTKDIKNLIYSPTWNSSSRSAVWERAYCGGEGLFSSFFDVDYIQERNCKDILSEIKNSKKNNIYIEGYFQDIKYFKSYKFNLIKKIETAFIRRDFKLSNLNQSICVCLSNYSYGNILENKVYVNNINFFLRKNKNKFKYLYIFSSKYDKIFN
jgi:hypothetical protein